MAATDEIAALIQNGGHELKWPPIHKRTVYSNAFYTFENFVKAKL